MNEITRLVKIEKNISEYFNDLYKDLKRKNRGLKKSELIESYIKSYVNKNNDSIIDVGIRPRVISVTMNEELYEEWKKFSLENNIGSINFMTTILDEISNGTFDDDIQEIEEKEIKEIEFISFKVKTSSYFKFNEYCLDKGINKGKIVSYAIKKYINEYTNKDKDKDEKEYKMIGFKLDKSLFKQFKNICKNKYIRINETIENIIKDELKL